MPRKSPIIAYEFGTLYAEGDFHKQGDIALPRATFDNLWNFILSMPGYAEADKLMYPQYRANRKPCIKIGRYVGTLQTRDGCTIEILPKIYKATGQEETDQKVCRRVFLNMLRHFDGTKALNFQNALLDANENFPLLEIHIANYIASVENLLLAGLKKGYSKTCANLPYLKGKLRVASQITLNCANKARFAVQYDKFAQNIPQNRVIVSTLQYLDKISNNTANKSRIAYLKSLMSDIPPSGNIAKDLELSLNSNRLFAAYDQIMQSSKQILQQRGFTVFAGEYLSQSLFFQSEKLFESFIAYLFKKHAPSYKVSPQHSRFFLVDRHRDKGMFRLRPDIFVETDKARPDYDCIIIDTKWKVLDETQIDKNYLIDMKDMYQLFAYGHKYKQWQSEKTGVTVEPRLVMVYPCSPKFHGKLPDFAYEQLRSSTGLSLSVVAFDLSNPASYESQIHDIIFKLQTKETNGQEHLKYNEYQDTLPLPSTVVQNSVGKQKWMLVGCYKSEEHLQWILQYGYYNVRVGNRSGAVENSQMVIAASRLLLYNLQEPGNYTVYELLPDRQTIATETLMQSLHYPDIKSGNYYLLYHVGRRLEHHPRYSVQELRHTAEAENTPHGAPFYVQY